MSDPYSSVVASQFQAGLSMLEDAIEKCPDEALQNQVAQLTFSQAAFHVLFYTDLYLEPEEASFQSQPFHAANQAMFEGYEEMQPQKPVRTYDKPALRGYLAHCREKANRILASETVETLAGPSGFDWLKFSRAELHLYNLRHIQHHAAQLILRLRLDHGLDFRWVRSG